MRASIGKGGLFILSALVLSLMLGAAPAQANRALITEEALETKEGGENPVPPPEGQIEDACGLALLPEGGLYVSDYYHQSVEAFGFPPPPKPPHLFTFKSAISAGIAPEGPCQLAIDSKGALYANLWHESVVRLKPSFQLFDDANSTGVAVDSADRVYVNDRTHVAVYDSTGAQIEEIGAGGALKDAYGITVFGGRVYVPDAFDSTIKVFEPTVDPLNPAFTINGSGTPQHGFNSLVDAAVAIDPTNEHLLVLDNLQPGFEHPKAAIDEFDSNGAFLGQLGHTVIDGEPSGLVVEPFTETLFVTSGNSEEANAFAFGPYTESGPEAVESLPVVPASQGAEEAGTTAVGGAVAVGPSAESGSETRSAKAAKRRARRRAHRRAQRQMGRHRAKRHPASG